MAFGSRHDDTTNTNSRMKSVGMSIFEARSMPSRTPCWMTRWVMPRMTTVHTIGLMGLEEKLAKYCLKYSGSPSRWPISEA